MDAQSSSDSSASTGESNPGNRNDLTLLDCFDRPIAFHRCFVTLTGSITAALMLSQAYYWQKRVKSHDGWWFKTRDDWIEETGMGRYEQEGARKKLRTLGLLREELRGVPATLWYKVDESRLLEAIANLGNPTVTGSTTPTPVGGKPAIQLVENQPTRRRKNRQQAGGKTTNKLAGFAPTSNETETTTETTTEITTTTPNPSSTTEAAAKPETAGSGGSGGFDLIFDFELADLTPEQRERTLKTLEGLPPETAQAVLDEWNHAHARHSFKHSRWGWLRKVAETARAGQFIPSAELADRRRAARTPAPATTPRALPPERRSSALWRAQCEQLREEVPDADYSVYIAPLRGREDTQALWLEAPNRTVAEWVTGHLPLIEGVLRPHTELPVRVCIG